LRSKPANVKVTPDGKVKHPPSPTGTAAGLLLGTAAYRAPEQVRGKPLDKRADV
jgi:hypothetical protein